MSDKNGVQTRNDLYEWNIFSWKSVTDALEGINSVKRAGEIYLPIPAGFLVDDTASTSSVPAHYRKNANSKNLDYMQSNAPYYHSNPAYMAYLQRARFPDITLNTLRGLVGVATRAAPSIELPDKIGYLEQGATKDGMSLKELFSFCLAATLSKGRVTLVVDIKQGSNQACIVPYVSENFINWSDDEETGLNVFSVFEEKCQEFDDDFEPEEVTVNIVYMMGSGDNEGKVVVKRFKDGVAEGEERVPSLQGKAFTEIPVVTIGSVKNENDPNPAPLLGISEIAYAIYRKDADLSQAQHMTCNPMFTISGATGDGVPVSFGSTVALLLDNENAKAYFPETDTSALDHVSKSIQELFEEAANYGATILGPTKKAAEATETLKMRQGAQGATLVGVVNNVLKGINDAIAIIDGVSNTSKKEDGERYLDVSTDFAETTLSPQMLTALIGAWQAGAYSKESLIRLMIEAGFAEGEVEDEIAKIFTEGPTDSNMDDD